MTALFPCFLKAESLDDAACKISPAANRYLEHHFPGERIVTKARFSSEDLHQFNADHAGACPGKTELRGPFGYEVAVLIGRPQTTKTRLLLLKPVGNRWTSRQLDVFDGAVPVIWKGMPGKYIERSAERNVDAVATGEVVIASKYEAWDIAYIEGPKTVTKIWLSD